MSSYLQSLKCVIIPFQASGLLCILCLPYLPSPVGSSLSLGSDATQRGPAPVGSHSVMFPDIFHRDLHILSENRGLKLTRLLALEGAWVGDVGLVLRTVCEEWWGLSRLKNIFSIFFPSNSICPHKIWQPRPDTSSVNPLCCPSFHPPDGEPLETVELFFAFSLAHITGGCLLNSLCLDDPE